MNGEDYPYLLSETTLSTLPITFHKCSLLKIVFPSNASLLPKILQTLSKNGAGVNFYRPAIFYAIILFSLDGFSAPGSVLSLGFEFSSSTADRRSSFVSSFLGQDEDSSYQLGHHCA
jgi:hypothetical protein